VTNGVAPAYTDADAEKAWKPLADELMKRLTSRGMDKAAMLAFTGDLAPPKAYVEFWARILPGVPWASHSHERASKLYGNKVIGYTTSANMIRFAVDPAVERYHGWKVEPDEPIWTLFPRYCTWSTWPRPYFRGLEEYAITGQAAGVGRLPADFFDCGRGKGYVFNRYPRGWANMSIGKVSTWLAPGPDGPVTTVPFDLFREGVQECQARIFMEKTMMDPALRGKLGDGLAERAQEILDDRTRELMWVWMQGQFELGGRLACVLPNSPLPVASYAGSGWQERAERLFCVAADMERASGR
jgi:hypothetical protein